MEERVTQLEELYQNSKDTIECLKQTVKTLLNSQERDHSLHRTMDRILAVLDRQSKLTEATNTVINVVAEKINLQSPNTASVQKNGDILETVQRIEMYNEIYAKDFSRIFEKLDQMEVRISGIIEKPVEQPKKQHTDRIADELAKNTAMMDRIEKTVDSFIKPEGNFAKKPDLDKNVDMNHNKQIPILEPKRGVEDKQAVDIGEDIQKDEWKIQKVEEIKETGSGVSEETQAKVTLRKTDHRPRLFALPPENETLTVIGEGTEETNEICLKTAKDNNDNIHTEEDNKKGIADIKKIFELKSNKEGKGSCTARINDVSPQKPTKLNVPSGTEKQNEARHPATNDTSSSVSYVNLILEDKKEAEQNGAHEINDAGQQTESCSGNAPTMPIPSPRNLKQSSESSENKDSGSAAELKTCEQTECDTARSQDESASPDLPQQNDKTMPKQESLEETSEADPTLGIAYKCRTCKAELPDEVREDGFSVKCTERECGHRNIIGKLDEGKKWIFTYCNGKFHCHQVPLDTELETYFKCPICDLRSEIRDAHDWVALN